MAYQRTPALNERIVFIFILFIFSKLNATFVATFDDISEYTSDVFAGIEKCIQRFDRSFLILRISCWKGNLRIPGKYTGKVCTMAALKRYQRIGDNSGNKNHDVNDAATLR